MKHVGTTVFYNDDEDEDEQDYDVYCWVCGDDGHSPSISCQRAAGMID